jgi:hypothetical protein
LIRSSVLVRLSKLRHALGETALASKLCQSAIHTPILVIV